MKRLTSLALMLVFCISLSPTSFAQADPPFPQYLPLIRKSSSLTVWTADPGSKIQPTTRPGTGKTIELEGARGATESYQVVVTAGMALANVNMTTDPLTDGAGHTIDAANLVFFREAFIDYTGVDENEPGSQPAPASSPTGDGRVPDPLIPFIDPYTPGTAAGAPFAVPAGTNQPVWLDVAIPAAAAAGTYTGMIHVTAEGQTQADLPLRVTVWDFTLPPSDAVTTWFGMHVNDLPEYHSNIQKCSGSSCWLDTSARARTIVKRYEELLHAHRASTWQNFVPDQQIGCTPPSDWTDYDAALQPYMDGSYWSDGVPSGFIQMPFTPGADWGIEKNCTQAQYTQLAQVWAAHMKAKGWFNKALVYAADEPEASQYPAIAKNSAWLQAGDSGWKAHIMDTTTPTPSDVAMLNPALGIYNVALAWYDNWSRDSGTPANQIPYGRSKWPSLFSQGIQLWFYESCAQGAPYPTFAANTLLGEEPRIMLWGAWYEHATGFLLWDTTYWTSGQPWGQNVEWGKSGDGVLIYPGNHDGSLAPAGSPSGVTIDGPIPSYRLKMVRAGLQDWALFNLAKQRGLEDYARAQMAQVYGQLGGCEWQGCPPKVNGQFFWKADETLIQQARHNIALAIMQAQ